MKRHIADTKATERINLKITPREKEAWQAVANNQGVSLSRLIKEVMNTKAPCNPKSPA